jgi:WD40-like Beta Propeller Repeat
VHPLALVLALAALVAAGCAGKGEAGSADGTVVLTAFQVAGAPGCGDDGLWALEPEADRPRLVVGDIRHEELTTLDPAYPRFTPDGRTLVFGYWQYPAELPTADIYRMDVASGRVTRVFEGAIMFLYRWAEAAPVFVTARGDNLVVVDASTGRSRELGRGEGPDPALDPRGDRLAYSRRGKGGRSLWVRGVAGDTPRKLTEDGQWPFWSRDGTRVAFFPADANDSEPAELRVVPARGGKARRLVDDAMVGRVLWTHDEVLFLRLPAAGADGTEHGVGDLYAVPADGGAARKVAAEVVPLEVSPDGKRLLFLRPHAFDGELSFSVRTMGVDGGSERVLAVIDEEDVNIGSVPAWQREPRDIAAATGRFAPSPQRSARCGQRFEEARARVAGD